MGTQKKPPTLEEIAYAANWAAAEVPRLETQRDALLEALERLMGELSNHDCSDPASSMVKAVTKARQAIALVKGEA